jgi:hypothetical protein
MSQHATTQKTIRNPERSERKLADILTDTRATFTSPHGQRELALLRESVRYDEPSFVFAPGGNPTDTHLAAFRDGRKSVIREIILRLETPEDTPEPASPAAIR